MNKKILISVLVIVVLCLGVFLIPPLFQKDLKESLADILNIESKKLILNLPPSPSRYPGSILLPYDKSYLVFTLNDSLDKNLERGKKFNINAKLKNSQFVNGNTSSGIMEGIFSNKQHFEILVEIKNGQIIELPIKHLKEYIKNHPEVLNALNKRQQPIILNRSYLGVLTYNIVAKDKKGAEILSEFEKNAEELQKRIPEIKINSDFSNNNKISFSLTEPIIIAYEAMLVSYIVDNLSNEDLQIRLATIIEDDIIDLKSSNSKIDLPRTNNKNWGLITIGSGHFENFATLDVPEAVHSASTVKKILENYDPKFIKSLISSENDIVTDDKLLDWTIDLNIELQENPVDYLVIYYAGHALTLPNGEMSLLQGNLKKDFVETAIENMDEKIANPNDGHLLVRTLYDSFEMTGIPFTIILDACSPNEEMEQALQNVNMLLGSKDGSNLMYIGDEPLITDEMSKISNVLSEIGNRFEYRTTTNPIIFSSKPGAKALFQNDPNSYYDLRLAPLAARLSRYSQFNLPSEPLSLDELLRMTVDYSGVGEVSLSGTITWSNLELMNEKLENVTSNNVNEF